MGAIDDLIECFGRAPLTSLKVDTIQSDATVGASERVFQTFPRLETLDVGGETGDESPLSSSGCTRLHGASTLGHGMGHADCRVACTNLTRVRVSGCGVTATYVAMLECFQCRADKGVGLDVLDLEDMYGGQDLTSCVLIKDLRLVVDCVRMKAANWLEGDFYPLDDGAWPAGESSDEG